MTRRRPSAGRLAFALAALLAVAGLVALGTWQVQRRAWKLALIDQVERRVHAAPVAPPGPEEWRGIGPKDAYLRVVLRGAFVGDRQTLVQAATNRGAGWWVITPLRTDAGWTVLVNRGFVSTRTAPVPPAGRAVVTGLLRVSEPGGGFLRRNDAAGDRWYSRDVTSISVARRLGRTAPYFIDADAAANAPGAPVGGLTVLRFPNNHLVYALTWYMLAMMVTAGACYVLFRKGDTA